MKLSLIIQAIDRATGPLRRIANATGDLGKRGLGGVAKAAAAADRVLEKIGGRRFTALIGSIGKLAGSAGRGGLWALEKSAYGAGKAIGFTIRQAAQLGVRMVALGAGAAAVGAGLFVRGVVTTASQFEQFSNQLVGLEGSSAKAKASLNWISKFAKETPYDIEQLTDAFVNARNTGIDPMNGSLRILGDTAAGNRETLTRAVEALADAQSFQYERLRAFGVTSSTKGQQVTFSYITKAMKAAKVTVAKDAKSIQAALLSIWDAKNGGNMARLSRAFTGIWSNIDDTYKRFQLKVAGYGFFDAIVASSQRLYVWLDKLDNNGTLDRWAKAISANLSGAVKWAEKFITKDTDWEKVGRAINEVADAVRALAEGFAALSRFGDGVAGILNSIVTSGRAVNRFFGGSGGAPAIPVVGRPANPKPFSLQRSGPRVVWPTAPAPSRAAPPSRLDVHIKTEPGVRARVGALTSPPSQQLRVYPSRGPVAAAG